jgi:hypothetical protein
MTKAAYRVGAENAELRSAPAGPVPRNRHPFQPLRVLQLQGVPAEPGERWSSKRLSLHRRTPSMDERRREGAHAETA